jgi:GIY-YIG catalytic domain
MASFETLDYRMGDIKIAADVFWWQKPAFQKFNYSGVYIIYAKDDKVLYVGESQNITTRLKEHRDEKENATKHYLEYFYRVEIYKAEHFDRLINEIYLINTIYPLLNTRHVVDMVRRRRDKALYFANTSALRRSAIEKEAIESECEPETKVFIELLDSIKEKDEDFYYNTSYFAACQEWKKRYGRVILEVIRDLTSLNDNQIFLQARVYAKALDDSIISDDNIFHPDNWGNLRLNLMKFSLHKKEAYLK